MLLLLFAGAGTAVVVPTDNLGSVVVLDEFASMVSLLDEVPYAVSVTDEVAFSVSVQDERDDGMPTTFVIGSRWRPVARCKAETTPGDGLGPRTLTDPTTLTLKVRDPSGTETTYTYAGAQITKRSTGIFYKDIDLTAAGRWSIRYIATGAVVDAVERFIEVPTSYLSSP